MGFLVWNKNELGSRTKKFTVNFATVEFKPSSTKISTRIKRHKHTRRKNYCKLVQETKPYGSWVSANKCRWKSANWIDSKPPEPSSNVDVWCPACKEVFWKRYLYKHISPNHAHFMMTPIILSSISMCPHERDYVKSLFEIPGKALTSTCPKNDKNPHDCDCAL